VPHGMGQTAMGRRLYQATPSTGVAGPSSDQAKASEPLVGPKASQVGESPRGLCRPKGH
jgi:hypothetical protein